MAESQATAGDHVLMLLTLVVLLIVLALAARNCIFMAEQPSSSIFELHPRFEQLGAALGEHLHKLQMWMQPFGGTTRKATLLYSNSEGLHKLYKPLDRAQQSEVQTYETVTDVSGQKKVNGTSGLKGTQAYPDGFGQAVAARYLSEIAEHRDDFAGLSLEQLRESASDDPWDDACLDEVLQALRSQRS